MSLGSPASQSADVETKKIDLQKLVNILTAIDQTAVRADGNESIVNIMQRLLPDIPEEYLIAMERQASETVEARMQEMREFKKETTRKKHASKIFYAKLSLSIAIGVAALYFGGPIAVKGTELAVTQIYTILFGIPSPGSVAFLLFTPCKEFLCGLASQYGSTALAFASVPTTYGVTTALESLYRNIASFISLVCPEAKKVEKKPQKAVENLVEEKFIEDMIKEFEGVEINDEEKKEIEAKVEQAQSQEPTKEELDFLSDFVILAPCFESQKQTQLEANQAQRMTKDIVQNNQGRTPRAT